MKEANAIKIAEPEDKLRVSYKAEANLDSFLNNLPDAVIITTPDYRIKAFNYAAEAFFGRPASHFIGKALEESINFRFRYVGKEVVLRQLAETGVWNGHIIVVGQYEQEFIFQANVSALYDENACVSSIVFVHQNITEQERQAKSLKFAKDKYEILVESLSEGVLLINNAGIIVAINNKAGEILNLSENELKGSNLINTDWYATRVDGSVFPIEEYPAFVSLQTGKEMNDVILGLIRGKEKTTWLSINSRPIKSPGTGITEAVVISFKDITKEKTATENLRESEILFRSFMSNSPNLAWIYDEDGHLVYGNPLFLAKAGLTQDSIGKSIKLLSAPELADTILSRNKQVVSQGHSMITEDEIIGADGHKLYFIAHWFVLAGTARTLIGGQAIDITDKIQAHQYIEKMHERFRYVVNASSDAIWDLDLRTNEIYRSDAFSTISGYEKAEISPTLDWWFDKIHPDDKRRVNDKVEKYLEEATTNWEDEYRFQHADGTYRFISDKGFTIYENGVAIRQIGSVQDITARKKLEKELLNEQVQKQKLINQATINAQEDERNRISGELHDNVNQLLISSRLHIGVAKNNPANQEELLNKATEYLMMAVEEIRALSKRMNSHIVSAVGLKESINNIAFNMQKLNDIYVTTEIDECLIEKLSKPQQLMIFRIVQEQSTNIIKHASAATAHISMLEYNNRLFLEISDNGKGFDSEAPKVKGLGFINMFNRVDAYSGHAEIISFPGQGCTVKLSFPIV